MAKREKSMEQAVSCFSEFKVPSSVQGPFRTNYGADKFLEFSVPSLVLFTSTETIRIIRDGEPRTATSTFTQLLSSERVSALLYVYRDHKDY